MNKIKSWSITLRASMKQKTADTLKKKIQAPIKQIKLKIITRSKKQNLILESWTYQPILKEDPIK